MRTFAKNQPHKQASSSLAQPHRATPAPSNREHHLLDLQHATGNQVGLRQLQFEAEEHKAAVGGTLSPRLGHDLSRIPVHPPAAKAIQTKLAVSESGDEYEQEADRISEHVMSMPEPRLQRSSCTCGGECPKCITEQAQQEHNLLQTKQLQSGEAEKMDVPPIVNEVLNSPGQPLHPSTRAFMESRFGHDFSRVRVHTDARAAESAEAVNALAYTVGRNVVFAAGQYEQGTAAGRHLIAHELSHVVQQSNSTGASLPERLKIEAPNTVGEQKADYAATRVASNLPAALHGRRGPALMRKLRVERPTDRIPNSSQQGTAPTNAETIEGYLRALSPQGNVTVNRTSGVVSMETGFCPGGLGGLIQGGKTGYHIGHTIGSIGGRIPLLGPILGGIGALIGGLIGGVGGLFGADISPAASSSTPTGSTCVCYFVNTGKTWRILIDDTDTPLTGDDFVRIQSPNSPRAYGAATVSGRLEAVEPWLELGHELCGHAWLMAHARRGEDEEGTEPGERHHRTVERENLIRAEHGLEARGFRLRDPYCGESFSRERGAPADSSPQWQRYYDPRTQEAIRSQHLSMDANRTYLDECQEMRLQYLGERARRYRLDERIP